MVCLFIKINSSDDESVDTPSILADNGSENEYLPSDSGIMSSEEGKHNSCFILLCITICSNNMTFYLTVYA